MAVELSPVEELDLEQAILDFATEHYCANCKHFSTEAPESNDEADGTPYCEHWADETTIESGMICQEYRPKGYE